MTTKLDDRPKYLAFRNGMRTLEWRSTAEIRVRRSIWVDWILSGLSVHNLLHTLYHSGEYDHTNRLLFYRIDPFCLQMSR
jgi:hypothetical protein